MAEKKSEAAPQTVKVDVQKGMNEGKQNASLGQNDGKRITAGRNDRNDIVTKGQSRPIPVSTAPPSAPPAAPPPEDD